MWWRKSVRCAAALAVVAGVAACSDDDPTGPSDLSPEQAEQFTEAMANAGLMGGPFMGMAGDPASGDLALADVPAFEEVHEWATEADCPEGGTVHYEGTVTESENEADFDLTMDASSCGSSDNAGNSWVFDGVLQTTMSMYEDDESFEWSGSHSGTLDYSGHLEGSCSINVEYSFSGHEGGFSGGVNGTVCGHDVSTSAGYP